MVLVLACILSGCAAPGMTREVDGVQILSSAPSGTRLALLADATSPVLVVKSPKGIGRARLRLPASLPQGLIIEFPGMQSLEQFVLGDGRQHLVCSGGAQELTVCSWGEEWPVGQVRRYPSGMTVTLPAHMFSRAGKWSMEWVDYWRQ